MTAAFTSAIPYAGARHTWDFCDGAAAVFAEGMANDGTRGYMGGTATGLTSGQDFGDALETGFAGGVFTASGPYFNSLVGHGIDTLTCRCKPEFRNGAFYYEVDSKAVTLGGVILGASRRLGKKARLGGNLAPYRVRTHELGHVSQSSALEFFYDPACAAALTVSGAIISATKPPPSGASIYRYYNPLECGLNPNPSH